MQVGFVYTSSMLEHQGRSKHPEKPARLTTILERVEKKRLLERCRPLLKVAAGETVILLHPPLGMERECHQNDSLADGYQRFVSRAAVQSAGGRV